MEHENNLTLEGTPLFLELCKTQAYIKTLASFLLTHEQRKEFGKEFSLQLKESIKDLLKDSSFIISDENEEIRKFLNDE